MRFLTCLAVTLVYCWNSFGQIASIELSNDFRIGETEYKDQTVSNAVFQQNHFYTVSNSGAPGGKWLFTKLYDLKYKVTLSKFDRDMNRLKEFKLGNGDQKYGPLMPELFLFNKQMILAYFESSNNTSFDLYLSVVDENDLSLTSPKKICSIQQENLGIMKVESILSGGLVQFTTSPDDSKLLVVAKGSGNKVQTIILNKNLEQLRQASFQAGLPSFLIESMVLTNDEKTCLTISSDDATRIIAINQEGKKTEMAFNAAGNLKPYYTKAKLARNGNSIIIYSTTSPNDQEVAWCNGLLIAQLDLASFKLSKPNAYEFPVEFIQAIAKQGGGEKIKKEHVLYNFEPNLLQLDNGTIAITGSPEASSTTTASSAPNSNNQSHMVATTTVIVGPVLVFYPNPNGNTFDHISLPRKIVYSRRARSGSGSIQMVQSPSISISSSGYISSVRGNEIILLYNDNESNLQRAEGEKTVTTKSAGDLSLAEAFINQDKQLAHRKLVSESQKGRSSYYLGNTVQNSTAAIVFPIAKEGQGFNSRKTFYTNWCFLKLN
ncbi:hypothetical protein KJS94_05175 [Flavihumibacter rivuli]|uniref:hypothetical protein n=1 Tax=Flavihumibacter rivuli TaxID=2838156 RepID=UPI001BDE7E12|nr:hypothetical protein [Flavihumibacter rivuli]ULQ57590.1 hypothetical protein KJS94_05175 [Flavihumibacter rivuli]